MTHGRSFFHSEYLSPPSHRPPPAELRAPALRCLHSWRNGTPRLPRRGGEVSPHTHTASSPPPRCGAPEGSRCLPAPWGGRRGTLPRAGGFHLGATRLVPFGVPGETGGELPWGPGRGSNRPPRVRGRGAAPGAAAGPGAATPGTDPGELRGGGGAFV